MNRPEATLPEIILLLMNRLCGLMVRHKALERSGHSLIPSAGNVIGVLPLDPAEHPWLRFFPSQDPSWLCPKSSDTGTTCVSSRQRRYGMQLASHWMKQIQLLIFLIFRQMIPEAGYESRKHRPDPGSIPSLSNPPCKRDKLSLFKR